MVVLGYFYREAREAASIDAAWRNATEALTGQSSGGKSIGTSVMKPSAATGSKAPLQPTPSLSRPAASSSYLASLSRQASNLASTVGLSAISDITFGSSSDGALFEFSEAERQKAKSILNDAAASSASASSSSSGSANHLVTSRSPYERSLSSSSRASAERLARGRSSSVWSSATSVSSVTQRGRSVAHEDTIW